MKKILFPILLSTLMLSSCIMYNGSTSSSESSSSETPTSTSSTPLISSSIVDSGSHFDPGPGGDIITYLVLSPIGQCSGVSGEDFPALHLTNTLKYTAQAGDDLPGADKISVTKGNGKFVNWVYYDTITNPGAPTPVTVVPEVSGMILYAQFSNEIVPYVPPTQGEVRTFYFLNEDKDGNVLWNDVKFYCWDSALTSPAAWPGSAMSSVEGHENLFKFEATYGTSNWIYPNVIFNGTKSGTLEQTVDSSIAIYTSDNTFYISGDKDSSGHYQLSTTYTEI